MSLIKRGYVMLGSDPEFFFTKKGRAIGSEKVLPEAGLAQTTYIGKAVRDGIQAELNPGANTCRQGHAGSISQLFKHISEILPEDVKVSFQTTVAITKKEMLSLSMESKVFGCDPSLNAYDPEESRITVDPLTYPTRSAGGHIHLGHGWVPGTTSLDIKRMKAVLADPRTVKLLDYVLGNSMVLLDRDLGNAVRREVYGKAGEYRLPKHGLEYRVLSNFWLRDYKLMSLVFGLARQVVSIASSSTPEANFLEEILGAVREADVRDAINRNDAALALRNFKKIEPILARITPADVFAFDRLRMRNFLSLAEMGIGSFVKKDPLKEWLQVNVAWGNGWETFAGPKGGIEKLALSKSARLTKSIRARAAKPL